MKSQPGGKAPTSPEMSQGGVQSETPKVSRRTFLKSAAGLAASVNFQHLWRGSTGDFLLSSGDGWLAISWEGTEKFRLDTRRFHGRPRLTRDKSEDAVLFSLENARFPGTKLFADLRCEIWPGTFGLQTLIEYPQIGLVFRGHVHNWLGDEGLFARVSSAFEPIRSDHVSLLLDPGQARLTADGALHFSGSSCARIELLGHELRSDLVQLHLPGEHSLVLNPSARRTRVFASRGDQAWPVVPTESGWHQLSDEAGPMFDGLELEISESTAKSVRYAAAFSRSDARSPIPVELDNAVRGTDGRSPQWFVTQPKYTVQFGSTTSRRTTAELEGVAHLQMGNLSLNMLNPRGRPAFTASSGGNCIPQNCLVVEAQFTGYLGEDLVFPAKNDKPWHITVDSEDLPNRDDQAKATLAMDGVHPVLKGALQFRIVRPQDQLDLSFRLTNVTLKTIAVNEQIIYPGPDPSGLSLLIADLPPQVLLEPALKSSSPLADDNCPPLKPPTDGTLRSRLAPSSRVSMQLFSDGTGAARLNTETFLQWAKYPLHIAPSAVQKPKNATPDPCSSLTEDVTAIEMPAGLIFSPDETQGFYSSDQIRADKDVSQIWTARLASRNSETFPAAPLSKGDTHPSVRPVFWRHLPDSPNGPYGFDDGDRCTIVDKLVTSSPELKHLAVSALGGWIDVAAKWDVKCGETQDRESFKARVSCGVEILEDVTYKAFLVPTGHRISVVKTTQRQWCRASSTGELTAVLIQRYKILFDEKTRVYEPYRQPKTALGLPVKSISLIGKETLYLDYNAAKSFVDSCNTGIFQEYWGEVDLIPGTPTKYAFPVVLEDCAGNSHHTTMPMVVACGNQAWAPTYLKSSLDAYNAYNSNSEAGADLGKERVAYAQPQKNGDTAYPTGRMRFFANPWPDVDGACKTGLVPWYPTLLSAELSLDQTATFSVSPPPAVLFQYSCLYTKHPFDYDPYTNAPDNSNRAEVLLERVPSKNGLQLGFNGKLGGGLAMPSTNVQAISRRQGTIFTKNLFTDTAGDIQAATQFLTNVGQGLFEGSEAFGTAALLVGAVGIGGLLEQVSDTLAQAAAVPILAAQQILDVEQSLLDQFKSAIQPLLSFQTDLDQAIQQITDAISAIQGQIRQVVGLAVSSLRVAIFEQAPTDVSDLAGSSLPAPIPAQATTLQAKLAESMQYRIQYSSTLFQNESGAACFPTLPQVRDYLFNRALTQIKSLTDPYFQTINDYLAADTSTLTQELTNVAGSVDKFFIGLQTTSLFKLADDLDQLASAVQQQDFVQVLTSLGQVSDDVGAALNASDQINQFVTDSKTAFQNALADCTTDLQTYVDKYKSAINASHLPVGLSSADVASIVQSINSDFALGDPSNALGTAITAANTGIALVNQIETVVSDVQSQIEDALTTASDTLAEIVDLLSVPKQISVTYDYDTPLKSDGVFIASNGDATSELALHSKFLANLDGSPPQLSVSVSVTNFTLLLLPSSPFISVGFTSAQMTSLNGSLPQVSCKLDETSIKFLGPLDFVAELAKSIQLPLGLNVQQLGTGLIIGVDLPIPSIESGLFLLTGLALHCGVHLDFTGQPLRLVFGFASPNQHFIVAYALLGGGGFIQLEVTPTATDSQQTTGMIVTGAIELGAVAELDFGVASGEAHVFAGFYFSLQQDYTLLSGYLRAGGELDVLGLISVCVEFLMSLTYEDRGGQAWLSGECDVSVEVDVLFFSESVSLRLHHDFSGNSAN
ncbi:MAG TPA: hypothetical protein VIH88_15300 [Candidatus Acidoferrales bacterium]